MKNRRRYHITDPKDGDPAVLVIVAIFAGAIAVALFKAGYWLLGSFVGLWVAGIIVVLLGAVVKAAKGE